MNIFVVLMFLCSTSFAAGSVPVLVPGVPVAGNLLPSASLSYRVVADEDFRVLLQQGHWDFAIDILEPTGGAVRRTVDAFGYELESASLVRGPALVRIRRVDSDSKPADFTLSIRALSEGDRADAEVRMRAEDAMTAAREMGKRGSGARQEAVKLSREALMFWERTGERGAVLRSSLLLADSLHLAASYDEALGEYTRALAAADSAHSRAECLANRGSTYWRLGRFSEALKDMRDSLAIWKALPVQSGLGDVFSNLGLVLWEIGEYDDSLVAFHDAASVMRTLGNRRSLAFVANNSALVEGTLGDYPASARSFERAAALFDGLRDQLAAGRARTNSARIYLKLGNPVQAEAAARRGLALVEMSGNQPALAEGMNLLGEVLAACGRKDGALGQFHRALSLARTVGDVRAEANALTNIGRVLLTTNGRAAGISFLQDSLKLWRRFGAPAVEASVLFHLAVGQRDRGDLAAARDSVQAALKITEGLRAHVAAVDLRIGFMADRLQLYDAAVDIFERSGEVEQAWNAAEMSRARGLLDSLAVSRAESDPQRRLRQEFNAESVRLARGGSRDAEQERKRLDLISAELVRQQESEASPASLLASQVASLATLQQVLPDDTAVLEYTAGEPAYAWVITRKSIFSFPLRHLAMLASEALSLAGVMHTGEAVLAKDGDAAYRKAALALGAALIWPALPHLETVTRLVVVTDSRLDFPTTALPLPGGGAVVDRFEVLEVPSAGMFVELAKRPERVHAKWPVAILADGVFSREDPRVTVPTPDSSPAFSRLVFSGREAATIASLIPEPDRLLLLGFDATKGTITSGRLRGYPVIHVSTHSVLGGKTPALVFSLVNPDGSARDGLLTSNELAGTDLRSTELLVLSACHSAAGPVIPGEGTQNLARSALLAGAARVIATRWPVDDEAASRLFEKFYALLWKGGLSPVAALREAQLSLRSEARFSSLYYWGAYYLVGKL
jgi:CHAT domain-containing protein/Tfp pilus assembly protein PilF